jgi:5-methylthioribose kinase
MPTDRASMFEITPDNAVEFLRSKGWIDTGPAQVELLAGGVSNIVLRVTSANRKFVLKQSCPQLRTKDAWFSDIDRIYREQEIMEALHALLPPLVVPEVLFSDRDNYVFVMSHAPEPFRVWKEMLLAGNADPAIGKLVGQVLGRMHQATAGNERLREQFADVKIFDQLRIDPFYRTVQWRRPDVAKLIEPIVERMVYVKDAICHGDYTPKNILVHHQGFTLVDYETAHYGDATMDVGLLLAHLVLKAFRNPAECMGCLQAALDILNGYGNDVAYRPKEELERWCIEHLAVCLLARIDGTSPVDYIPEEPKRQAVRVLARQILQDRITRWHDVFRNIELGLTGLRK